MSNDKKDLYSVGYVEAGQEEVDFVDSKIYGVDENGTKITGHLYAPVPKNDEEAVDMYGCDLAELIKKGVRQISYAPTYALEFIGVETDKNGKIINKGIISQEVVDKCQELLNNYKVGQRKTGESAKTKMAMTKIKAFQEKTGKSFDEVMAMIEKMEQ